jgi:malonyl-CoA/methylmalonyl-CoA synthetase
VPHPDFGEAVMAAVVVAPSSGVNAETIKAMLAGQLASFKLPKAIFVMEELPRNTMGKVQKNALRETYKDAFQDTAVK